MVVSDDTSRSNDDLGREVKESIAGLRAQMAELQAELDDAKEKWTEARRNGVRPPAPLLGKLYELWRRTPFLGRLGSTASAPAPVLALAQPTLSTRALMDRAHALLGLTRRASAVLALPREMLPILDLHWGTLRDYALKTEEEKFPPCQETVSAPARKSARGANFILRKVVVVILTWNGLDLTRRCLESLRSNTTHPAYEVWVVDNGSRDGTVEYLGSLPWIRLLENPENVGFVRGNNQALAVCDPRADVVLLNNDMEIHQPDWLERLQESAYAADDVGIVGCRLRRPDGRLQHAGAYMPLDSFWGQQIAANEEDVGQYTQDRDVESVVFACAYLKRETLQRVGLLDERYFAYFEDSDYCLTAQTLGYRTVCCGSVTLDHRENSSTQINRVSHSDLFKRSQALFRDKWEMRLHSTRYSDHLDWRSTINLPTGYGISSREMVLALDRLGIEVAYRYLYGPGTTFPLAEPEHADHDLLNHVRQRPFDPQGVQVVYGQGDAFHRNDGRYRIGYTMLEIDGFPRDWVRQANRMDEVWVPSAFNMQTMRNSGVVRPIHVVPLGIDPHYFHPQVKAHRDERVFTFLAVLEWGERKAPEILLRAFTDEFGARDDVVLLLKVVNRDEEVDVREQIAQMKLSRSGARVVLSLNDVIPSYQLGSLYRSADCLVLASRGEGWGMPALEAMACGLPVIATQWSAMTEFLDESVGYPLQIERLVPAQAKCPYYKGFRWAEPSYDHLRALMRHVFEHPDDARARGSRAAEAAQARWTWDHTAQRIRERLRTIEAKQPSWRAEERVQGFSQASRVIAGNSNGPDVKHEVERTPHLETGRRAPTPASHRAPTMTSHRGTTDEYIQLVKEIVLNSVYEPGPHLDEGRQWPPRAALTMIGRKRLDNVHELAQRVLARRIPGDLIETGVWRGGAAILMRAMLKAHDIHDRRVFAADSFCGLPPVNVEAYPADRVHAGSHEMEILVNNSMERVQESFARLHLLDDQVVFLKGWFKDTLPRIPTTQIALMRLDGDLYESTWDALTNLYPKLSLGGYVIIDDMCWEGCVKAVEDYRRMNGIAAPMHQVDWTGVYWEKTAEIAKRTA